MRTGRVAGAADIADRLPLFYFRTDRHTGRILHMVVLADQPVRVRYLDCPAVTVHPAIRGYLAALERLDRRAGGRRKINGVVVLGTCRAVRGREGLPRTKGT